MAPHPPGIIENQQIGCSSHIPHPRIEPQVEAIGIENHWHPVISRSWLGKVSQTGPEPLPSRPFPDSQSRRLWLNKLRLLRNRPLRATKLAAPFRLQECLRGRGPTRNNGQVSGCTDAGYLRWEITEESIEVYSGNKNDHGKN